MRSIKYIAILFIFGLCIACSQKIQPEKMDNQAITYSAFWEEIDSLEHQGQYKTAYQKILEKHSEFEASSHEEQVLKATFYEAKYQARVSENSSEKSIAIFERKLANLADPKYKKIYHSILGELYEKYAQANQFKIAQRTQVNSDSKDIATWSMQDLITKSNAHYIASVETLQTKNNARLSNNILNKSMDGFGDFDLNTLLITRAIRHFSYEFTLAIDHTNDFILKSDEAFADKKTFSAHTFQNSSSNTKNSQLRTLELYQALLRYQSDNLLVDRINIDRLKYAYRISQTENKEELYVQRLRELSHTSDYAKYELAELLYNQQDSNLKGVRELLLEVGAISTDSTLNYNVANLISRLESTHFDIKMEEVLLPSQPSLFSITYKNINDVSMSVKPILDSEIKKYRLTRSQEEKLNILNNIPDIESWNISLPDSEYRQLSTESMLPKLPIGSYVLLSNHAEHTVANFFQVSNIAAHTLSTPKGNHIQVYHRESGEAYPNVKIEVIEEKYTRNQSAENVIETLQTNSNGEAFYKANGRMRTKLRLSSRNDTYNTAGQYINNQIRNNTQTAIHIFTDRNIYRPGNKLQCKAIPVTFDNKTKSNLLLTNEALTLIVRDPNYQEIYSTELVTNEFGSVAFDFIIDEDRLAGSYSIELKNKSNNIRGNQQFQVEEYKRPSFTTDIEIPAVAFTLGDSIQIKTHSELFSGVYLSNAVIEYRVTRSLNRYFYKSYFPHASADAEIVNGRITTDDLGNAFFDLPLKAPLTEGASYTFDIELTVADITGETQFASKSFRVNQSGFYVDLNIPIVLSNEQLENTSINAINSVGDKIEATVDVILYNLETPELWKKNKYWETLDTMLLNEQEYAQMPFEYSYNDGNQSTWNELSEIHTSNTILDGDTRLDIPTLKAGFYLLKIKSGDKLVTQRKFQIIDFNNRINPSQELISYRKSKSSYEVGDELVVDVSIPQTEVRVQYLIEKEGDLVSKKWLDATHQIKDKISKEDIGGFVIHLRSVFRNRVEYKKITVDVPYTSSKLTYTLDRFKSTLEPGEDVKWEVNFKDSNSKHIITESLWAMYDSSLDKLYREHDWRPFNLPKYGGRIASIYPTFRTEHSLTLQHPSNASQSYPRTDNSYPNINTYGFSIQNSNRLLKSTTARSSAPQAEASLEADTFSDQNNVTKAETGTAGNIPSNSTDTQAVRQNFNETVFFYPQVTSNTNGDTRVSFKMNDAMTSWKLLVFAHDKQGRFLYDTLHLRTTQDVFILANKPRFSRLEDDLWMTTKIVNNTTKHLEATTWIEFFDLETGANISDKICVDGTEKQISLLGETSMSIAWKLTFPNEIESRSIGFRTGVKHDNGSDVIEDYIQVLEDSQLVRESEALFLKAGETINYNLDSLGSGDDTQIHLELMTDLDWQIIQTLPYLDNKSFETCSNYLYQFIANSIGSFIVNNNASVKNQLLQIKEQDKSLQSQLDKKKDFKTIELKQTPWVRNADSEKVQRESMLKYLDNTTVNADLKKNLGKLVSFQNSDGGFSWLKDSQSSIFISSSVLQAIGRLNEKAIPHDFEEDNIKKLINFIDSEIQKELTKTLKNDNVADLFSYIHSRSYFQNTYPLTEDLISKFEKHYSAKWMDYPVSTQATIGSIADRLNIDELSEKIIVSIQEQAIESNSLGTYWKTNRNYFSNQSSVDKHVAVMEFLDRMDNKNSLLVGAKVWLINNKRTNAWKNKPSTSSAIFAFLESKEDMLQSNSLENIDLALGNKSLVDENSFIAKGTQTTLALNDKLVKNSSKLTITNKNKGPVWASIYKSYKKPIREIQSYSTSAIEIEKSIFIKELSESGPVLSSIESKELKPGDILTVQLTISNDRALQFVHLEDKRASGLEPKDVISKYKYTDALYYYQVTKDESTHFLINDLPRGTHVLEYDLTVNLRGEYSSGFGSIQCQYAPEFGAHSESINLNIDN